LHFGHLGPHTVALAFQNAGAPSKSHEAFLEQLIVRRELAINFVRFNPNYDSIESIEPWAHRALTVSTGNAVASTGRPDGFQNEAIKILLPENLRTVGKGLRLMGMGSQMDELEVGMNRAAERAAPEAKQIFINALTKMSFEDARKILSGNNTAATEYFKKQSSDELTTAFTPIVHKSMENVGVIQQYNQVMQNSMAAPLMGSNTFSLDKYVVGKTLGGLFWQLRTHSLAT